MVHGRGVALATVLWVTFGTGVAARQEGEFSVQLRDLQRRQQQFEQRGEYLEAERCAALYGYVEGQSKNPDLATKVEELKRQRDQARADGNSLVALRTDAALKMISSYGLPRFTGEFAPISNDATGMEPEQLAAHGRTLEGLGEWLESVRSMTSEVEHAQVDQCVSWVDAALESLREGDAEAADVHLGRFRAWIQNGETRPLALAKANEPAAAPIGGNAWGEPSAPAPAADPQAAPPAGPGGGRPGAPGNAATPSPPQPAPPAYRLLPEPQIFIDRPTIEDKRAAFEQLAQVRVEPSMRQAPGPSGAELEAQTWLYTYYFYVRHWFQVAERHEQLRIQAETETPALEAAIAKKKVLRRDYSGEEKELQRLESSLELSDPANISTESLCRWPVTRFTLNGFLADMPGGQAPGSVVERLNQQIKTLGDHADYPMQPDGLDWIESMIIKAEEITGLIESGATEQAQEELDGVWSRMAALDVEVAAALKNGSLSQLLKKPAAEGAADDAPAVITLEPTCIALTGGAAPGQFEGATFDQFWGVRVNDSGEVLFFATTSNGGSGTWRAGPGGLSFVTRETGGLLANDGLLLKAGLESGFGATGLVGDSRDAYTLAHLGADGRFSPFVPPRAQIASPDFLNEELLIYNNDGKTGKFANDQEPGLYYCDRTGFEPVPLLRPGDPVPGEPSSITFQSIKLLTSRGPQVLIEGAITGPGVNETGHWIVDVPSGALQRVPEPELPADSTLAGMELHEGVLLTAMRDRKGVVHYSVGRPGSLSTFRPQGLPDGQVVRKLSFLNGGQILAHSYSDLYLGSAASVSRVAEGFTLVERDAMKNWLQIFTEAGALLSRGHGDEETFFIGLSSPKRVVGLGDKIVVGEGDLRDLDGVQAISVSRSGSFVAYLGSLRAVRGVHDPAVGVFLEGLGRAPASPVSSRDSAASAAKQVSPPTRQSGTQSMLDVLGRTYSVEFPTRSGSKLFEVTLNRDGSLDAMDMDSFDEIPGNWKVVDHELSLEFRDAWIDLESTPQGRVVAYTGTAKQKGSQMHWTVGGESLVLDEVK